MPNVVQLAPLVDDVELVLFESDEYGSNLPDAATVAELGRLAEVYDPVVAYLVENMHGAVTSEVFGVDDFFSSKEAFEAAAERLRDL